MFPATQSPDVMGCVCRVDMDLSLISNVAVSSKPILQFHDVVVVVDVVVMVTLLLLHLVGNLVTPLLDGLNNGLNNWSLLDLSGGWDSVAGGLWETKTVAHSSWDIVSVGNWGNWGSSSHSWGSGVSSSIGVGESSVEENLSLGGSRGKSKNNLKLDHHQPTQSSMNFTCHHHKCCIIVLTKKC